MSKGFVVLISVVILSVVLLMIAQTLSLSGYFQGLSIISFESRERSYALAYSCLDRAYANLWQDFDYLGNETIVIGDYTCIIDTLLYVEISPTEVNTIIESYATVDSVTTTLQMTIDPDFNILSFKEL